MESLNKFTQKCPFGSILGKIDRLSKSFTALREDLSFRPFWAVEHWIKFI